jgi:hypothetical protein
MYNLYSYMFRHFHVIFREFTPAPRYMTQTYQIAKRRYKLPDDEMKMSKHGGA